MDFSLVESPAFTETQQQQIQQAQQNSFEMDFTQGQGNQPCFVNDMCFPGNNSANGAKEMDQQQQQAQQSGLSYQPNVIEEVAMKSSPVSLLSPGSYSGIMEQGGYSGGSGTQPTPKRERYSTCSTENPSPQSMIEQRPPPEEMTFQELTTIQPEPMQFSTGRQRQMRVSCV